MLIQDKILQFNRNPNISEWFWNQLNTHIGFGLYANDAQYLCNSIVSSLSNYRKNHNIDQVVLGISGGIDSAVTAALFREAGYTVTGVLMPILQDPSETERGAEVCASLGINTERMDLSKAYQSLLRELYVTDAGMLEGDDPVSLIRRGNVRARLRMVTLYNMASKLGGFVASTDNFSELAAGFWTLHGDVGDVSPIQSLTKSWEVPLLAEHLCVPQSVIDAVPTDGLGISAGDEAQFGFTYMEFDIGVFSMMRHAHLDLSEMTDADIRTIEAIRQRVKGSTHKRANPVNIPHPVHCNRYTELETLDSRLKPV